LRTQQKGIHPLTLTFQGLRIAVNRELEVLEKGLPMAIDLLNPGGLLAVISFHSLEDRLVKNAFRYASSDKEDTSGNRGVFIDKQPLVEILTRKPIEPTPEEIQSNPRSRSSKLRIIKKILFPIK
jgi:16S rRNA (cytosine1402-N4)-methyltransferase